MVNFYILLVFASLINLITASSISYDIIDQYIIFISFSAVIFVAEVLKIFNIQKNAIKKIFEVFFVISRLLLLAGFFILLTNVFVLRYDEKSCEHCVVADTWWILSAAVYLIFYFFFLSFSFLEIYKNKVK